MKYHLFAGYGRKYGLCALFALIPLVYLLLATFIHYKLGPFYLGRVDPEYFYLFNGIVLGEGNLSLQYFYHPGTPLHFIIAISSRIIDLFQPGDYMQGFVDDPETYLHAANLLLNALIAVVLFIVAHFTRKYTSSLFAALAIQVSPFAGAALMSLQGRVFADALLLIPLLLMAMLVIRYVFYSRHNEAETHDVLLFSLVTGFGIACKLTFLPMLLIPFVLLKITAKERARLLLYTALFFAIFAYPVVFNPGDFWHWAFGKFSQSGHSGDMQQAYQGLAGVKNNFLILFRENPFFFLTALSSLALAGLFSLPFIRQRSHDNLFIRRAILAINVAILLSLILILKHFKLYYLSPYTSLTVLLILLSAWLILSMKKMHASKLLSRFVSILFSALFIFILTVQIKEQRTKVAENDQRNLQLATERDAILQQVDKSRAIIIAGPYYGTPFIEFAHFNGFMMTGKMKGFYKSYLQERYARTFFFVNWTDKFIFWDDQLTFEQMLPKLGSSFYVYAGKENESDLQAIETRMSEVSAGERFEKKILYQDAKSGEQLVEFTLMTENL
jgi:hypothetical protein